MSEAMKDPQVKQLVETIQRLESLRLEAKNVARDYRERIEVIEVEVSVLAESIRSGQKRLFAEPTMSKGKTREELEALRDQIVEAGVEGAAKELISRMKAGEDGKAVAGEIIGRDQATRAAIIDAAANIAPRKGSSLESVSISHAGETVTLTQADGERMRETVKRMRRGARR